MPSVRNWDLAIDAHQRSIELGSDNSFARNNPALICSRLEMLKDALLLPQKTIRLENDILFATIISGLPRTILEIFDRLQTLFRTAFSLDSKYEKGEMLSEGVQEKSMRRV